jgi:hypothetical protein
MCGLSVSLCFRNNEQQAHVKFNILTRQSIPALSLPSQIILFLLLKTKVSACHVWRFCLPHCFKKKKSHRLPCVLVCSRPQSTATYVCCTSVLYQIVIMYLRVYDASAPPSAQKIRTVVLRDDVLFKKLLTTITCVVPLFPPSA